MCDRMAIIYAFFAYTNMLYESAHYEKNIAASVCSN